MRFCYLRIALLSSAIAANAFADTAERNVKLAASRTTSSPSFIRNNFAASAVTETHEPTSVDDEDRTNTTLTEFANLIGRGHESKHMRSWLNNFFKPIVRGRKTPKAAYDELEIIGPVRNLLFDNEWTKWAYFVYQVGHQFGENAYEFMTAAMSTIYDAEALYKILVIGIYDIETRHLAMNLAMKSNDHVKRLFFKRIPVLASELFHQEQRTAETIYKTSRGRIFAYLKKHVKGNRLPKKEYSFLISYLSVLLNKQDTVGTALSVSHKFSKDAALLETLLSLRNSRDPKCLESLVSIWLDSSIPPSQIVSMLVHDIAKADQFTILFSSGLSNDFWLRYFEMYNAKRHDEDLTRTATFNAEQLLQILIEAALNVNGSGKTFSDTAISTWLKVLTSPHIADLQLSQQYRNKLMSIWLEGGILPSNIVSALMLDKAEDKCFTSLFLNESSKSFWERYLKLYTQKVNNNVELMQSANVDLESLLKKLSAVAKQELPAADKYVAYGTILKLLISPFAAHLSSRHDNVIEVTSVLLLDRTLPSDVLSMLMRGETDADKFNILFVNKSSKSFWVRYLQTYNDLSKDAGDYTHTANTDFQQLLIMLHDVEVQAISAADRYLASGTILKILLSPETTNVIPTEKYLEEMTLNWLKQEVPPSAVVLMLVFEEAEADYFKILFTYEPSSKFWLDYTIGYYANIPSLQNHIMLTLTNVFGDADLTKILEAALTDEATRQLATSLLNHLNQWKLISKDNSQVHSSNKI